MKKRGNRLINEKSSYLLQHAENPVDWHPWEGVLFYQGGEMPDDRGLKRAYINFFFIFDKKWGGFGGSLKFPHPLISLYFSWMGTDNQGC